MQISKKKEFKACHPIRLQGQKSHCTCDKGRPVDLTVLKFSFPGAIVSLLPLKWKVTHQLVTFPRATHRQKMLSSQC